MLLRDWINNVGAHCVQQVILHMLEKQQQDIQVILFMSLIQYTAADTAAADSTAGDTKCNFFFD